MKERRVLDGKTETSNLLWSISFWRERTGDAVEGAERKGWVSQGLTVTLTLQFVSQGTF